MSSDSSNRLTEEFILKKTNSKSLADIHNLSLWGQKLTDVTAIESIPHLKTCAFSVNSIDSLKPFESCKHLEELFLRKNNINGLDQLFYLQDLKNLKVLWLSDNPIASIDNYRLFTIATLPQLKKLDQIDITDDERSEAHIMFPNPKLYLEQQKGPSPRNRPTSAHAQQQTPTPQQQAALSAIETLLPFLSKSELQELRETVQKLKKA